MDGAEILPHGLQKRAEDEDVVEDGEADEDPVEDGAEAFAQQNRDCNKVARETGEADDHLEKEAGLNNGLHPEPMS